MNETLLKFGYPNSLIKEYEHWCILLRPEQVTLGSIVLICKQDVYRFSNISKEAFLEYPKIIKTIENKLFNCFQYNKINYLMLMMIDPNVHFHIIPRYSDNKIFEGKTFTDNGWPGLPSFSSINKVNEKLFLNLVQQNLK